LRTLVIDNYDSFTYNLVHLLGEANQEEPSVVRNDEACWAALAEQDFDNIVISPGPGRPDRQADFGVSADAISHATVPILGICLGHQGIAVAHGGAVITAPSPVHGRLSQVQHCHDELFSGIPSQFNVVRYHSLVVARPLPDALAETAWTADGLIMALRHRSRPVWGVQFHPESVCTEYGPRLIANFRDLTRRWRNDGRTVTPVQRSCDVLRSAPSKPLLRAVWRELPRAIDTEATFCTLFANSSMSFWLDSSLVEPGRSNWSFMGDASGPRAAVVSYDTSSQCVSIRDAAGERVERTSIFAYLERSRGGALRSAPPCPFVGGHVGWFGYELRNECGSPTARRAATPSAFFIRADRFIAVDHSAHRSYVVAICDDEGLAVAERWVDSTADAVSQARPPLSLQPGDRRAPVRFALDRGRRRYLEDIERCLEWIRQGETYQVCLTNELACDVKVDALDLYRTMRRINPAPHAGFLRWPGGAVLSASPERFLSVDRAGRVEAKPIKGTIGRAQDPEIDRRLAERLLMSEKDRAENLMIVDLLRNDLSRVCRPGSVEVPSLFAVESYATVHQLVSTVQGVLRSGATTLDLIRAAFPGGSMTGAPKHRTLDFIDHVERRARGVYSGALGWLGDDGAADLSIVIRAVVAVGAQLSMGIGGGVVAQSTPDGEFEEMMLKARASVRAIVTATAGRFDVGLVEIDHNDRPARTRTETTNT
jgi:para-aminobenzoate synthetase